MKNKQYVILAISALAAGSMSLTTFATPADSQDIAVTASIGGYTMMGGLDDIQLSVAADVGEGGRFTGSASDDFCVVASANVTEQATDALRKTSPIINILNTTHNVQFIENGIYQLDVTANALVLNGNMAGAVNAKYFLAYRVSIDDIADTDSYQVTSNNNNLTCNDNNHRLKIMVYDTNWDQLTGNYQGTVTVAVSGHAGS